MRAITRSRVAFGDVDADHAGHDGHRLAQRLRIGAADLDDDLFAAAKPLRQVLRRVDRHDLSTIDDDDAIGDLADLGQDVRRQHNRVLAAQADQQVAHFDTLFRIEARGRLVEDQHFRLVHDGLRQADALLESLRQGGDALARDLAQRRAVDRAIDAGRSPRPRHVLDLSHEIQILTDRQLRIQRGILWQIAKASLGLDGLLAGGRSRQWSPIHGSEAESR